MFDSAVSPYILDLMKLIETQSNLTIANWCVNYVKNEIVPIYEKAYPKEESIKEAMRAYQEYINHEMKLLNVPCHKEQLKSAWKNVMFNQFHDILAGCCIKGAYDEADTAYAAARNTAIEIEHLALQRIAWNIKTTDILNKIPCQKNAWILWEKEGEGAPVVVFNPHSFPVVSAVQLNIKVSKVIDVDGKSVAIQYVRGQQTNGLDRENTIFEAVVPAFGYSLYYLYKEEESVSAESMTVKPDSLVLENNYLKVKFNERCGTIESFFDKEANSIKF